MSANCKRIKMEVTMPEDRLYLCESSPQNSANIESMEKSTKQPPSKRSKNCQYQNETFQSRGSAKKPSVRDEINLEIARINRIKKAEQARLKAKPTTFTESKSENGDIVLGIDGLKTSIPKLCKLRKSCDSQRRLHLSRLKCGTVRRSVTRIQYEKIVSAVNNRIKYLDGNARKIPKKTKTKNTRNKTQLGQIMTRNKEISAKKNTAKLKQNAVKTKQKTVKPRTTLSLKLRSSCVLEPKSQENQVAVSSDDPDTPKDSCSSSKEQEPPGVAEREPTVISVRSLQNTDQIVEIKEEFDENVTFEPQYPQIISPVDLNVRFSHSRQDIDVSDITNAGRAAKRRFIQCISKEANSEPDCPNLDNSTEKADNSHEKTSICNNTMETDQLNVCDQGGVHSDSNSLGINDFVEKVGDKLRDYFTEIDRLNKKYGIRDCKVLLGSQELFGRLGVVSVTVPKDNINQALNMMNPQPALCQKHTKMPPTCTAKPSNSLRNSNKDYKELDSPSARCHTHFNTTEITHLSRAEMPNANIVEADVLNSCSEVAQGLDTTALRPQFEKHSKTTEITMNSANSPVLDITAMQATQTPDSPEECPVMASDFSKHCNEVPPGLEMHSLQPAHFQKDLKTAETPIVSDNSSECNNFDQGLDTIEISEDEESNTSASDCNESDESLEITNLQSIRSQNQSTTAEMSKTCTVNTLDSLKNSENSDQGMSSLPDQQNNSENATELLKTCISMASDVLKSCNDVGRDLENMDTTDLPLARLQEHLKTSEMLKQCVVTASNLLQNCSNADQGLYKTSLLSTPCQNRLTTTEMSKTNSYKLRPTRCRRLLRTTKSPASSNLKASGETPDLLQVGGKKRAALLLPAHESGCARLHAYTRLYDDIDPVEYQDSAGSVEQTKHDSRPQKRKEHPHAKSSKKKHKKQFRM